jgi:hypothetical protein
MSGVYSTKSYRELTFETRRDPCYVSVQEETGMRVSYYDPDQRALDKAESRRRDEEALISGRISLEELQRVNGGYGMFRSSKLMRRPKGVKAADWKLAPAL